jgi:hypothetical protein
MAEFFGASNRVIYLPITTILDQEAENIHDWCGILAPKWCAKGDLSQLQSTNADSAIRQGGEDFRQKNPPMQRQVPPRLKGSQLSMFLLRPQVKKETD